MRQLVTSGSPFEKKIAFSRACRIGNMVAVAGTAPIATDGRAAFPNDLYRQTKRCFEIAEQALIEAGGSLRDTIRTRIMLTDISRWEEAAQAHGEIFAGIQPAATFVQVSAFIDPEWLVEIELDAALSDD